MAGLYGYVKKVYGLMENHEDGVWHLLTHHKIEETPDATVWLIHMCYVNADGRAQLLFEIKVPRQ